LPLNGALYAQGSLVLSKSVIKIFGIWLVPAICVLLPLFFSGVMLGGFFALVFLALAFLFIGSLIHILLAWKYPKDPSWSHFLFAFVFVIIFFLVVEYNGAFSFT
jgi:hypothetical protein